MAVEEVGEVARALQTADFENLATLDFMQRGEKGRWQDLRNALAALAAKA